MASSSSTNSSTNSSSSIPLSHPHSHPHSHPSIPQTPSNTVLDFSCVFLCGSIGARLFPLTGTGDDAFGNDNSSSDSDDDSDDDDDHDISNDNINNTASAAMNMTSISSTLPIPSPKITQKIPTMPLSPTLSSTSTNSSSNTSSNNTSKTTKGNINTPNNTIETYRRGLPKFLLPIAGGCTLSFLIKTVEASGLPMNRVYILAVTEVIDQLNTYISNNKSLFAGITVLPLPVDCGGSADALREVKRSNKVPSHHHIVMLPADIVLESPDALVGLCETHRKICSSSSRVSGGNCNSGLGEGGSSVTMLLADVGEEDSEGRPIKESTKGKMGLVQRESEDIELIGCAVQTTNGNGEGKAKSSRASASNLSLVAHTPTRVLLKQSKTEIDEREDNVGDTPKLLLPKAVIRAASTSATELSLRTDLLDLHVYVISPWVWDKLLHCASRQHMNNVQTEVCQLLISRQLRGYASTFGVKESVVHEYLGDGAAGGGVAATMSASANSSDDSKAKEYIVGAHILPRNPLISLRACSIQNYLYLCREVVTHAIRPPSLSPNSLPSPFGRINGRVNAKDNSVLLEGAEHGSGCAIKNTTIGARVRIGNKCKINNSVIMDDVILGDGCVVQNTIVCGGVTCLDGCNFNDVQIAGGVCVPAGTKLKGETIEE